VIEIIEPRVIRRTSYRDRPPATTSPRIGARQNSERAKGIPSLEAPSFRAADNSRNKKPTIATIRPLRKSGRHTSVTRRPRNQCAIAATVAVADPDDAAANHQDGMVRTLGPQCVKCPSVHVASTQAAFHWLVVGMSLTGVWLTHPANFPASLGHHLTLRAEG
jgi:hypothetical protein